MRQPNRFHQREVATAPTPSSAPSATRYTVSSCTSFTVTMRRGSSRNARSSCAALGGAGVRTAGDPRDRPQGRLVDLEEVPPPSAVEVGREAAATADRPEGVTSELLGRTHQRARRRGTEADGEHPDAAIGRLSGGVERIDAGGGSTIGEQHDDVGDVLAREAVLSALRGRELHGARRNVGVDPGQRVDRREHAVADRGADRRREPVDRLMQLVAVRRGWHQDLRAPRERHQTQARTAGLVVDELPSRGLGGGEPVRADVGRAHRPRDVDGDDDRRVAARRREQRLRTRRRQDEHGDRGQQQRGRNPPAPAGALRLRLLDQRQAGKGHGVLAPPPPRPEVRTDHDQREDEPDQRERPEEAHAQITRPYQRIESPAAARNSKSPPAAKKAVISVLRPAMVRWRSMLS